MKNLQRPTPAEKDTLIAKLFDLVETLEKRLAEFEKKVEKTSVALKRTAEIIADQYGGRRIGWHDSEVDQAGG
ncbi:MAG: hypothetical protein FJ247_13375 [Nitrospira sp.]|nr:hypothetical protein [Nitrospira sp.]